MTWCPSLLSAAAVINTMTKNALWEWHLAYTSRAQPITSRSQGRDSSRSRDEIRGGELLSGLLAGSHPSIFLIQPRTTYLRMVPQCAGTAYTSYQQENAPTDIPTKSQSDAGNTSKERSPFSRCVSWTVKITHPTWEDSPPFFCS